MPFLRLRDMPSVARRDQGERGEEVVGVLGGREVTYVYVVEGVLGGV